MPGYNFKPSRKCLAGRQSPLGTLMTCPECELYLREPVQLEDGTRLCESCCKDILEFPGHKSSKTGITVVDGTYRPDKAVRKEIQQLQDEVLCKNSGCLWMGKVCEYQAHERVCSGLVSGPSNSARELKVDKDVRSYQDNYFECIYCGEFTMGIGILSLKQNVLKCPKCGHENTVQERFDFSVAQHQSSDQYVLRLAHVVCDAIAGVAKRSNLCWTDVKLAAKQTLEAQLTAYLETHSSDPSLQGFTQVVLAEVIWSDYTSVSPLKAFLEVLQTNAKVDLSQEISRVDDLLHALNPSIWSQIERVQEECNNCPPIQTFNGYRSPSPQSPVGLCCDFAIPVLCTESNSNPFPGMDAMDDVSRLRMLERTCEDLQRKFYEVHQSRSEAQPGASYDGTLIWKIPDVRHRRKEAVYKKKTSLYSPPFYTSRNGYKICMQAYLNGVGDGYKTHISLLFVLMRGEFDALLKWPFDQKVSLTLVDQNHHKNIVQTFRPEPESGSFQQPQTEMNVASGFPKFADLSVFDDPTYVRDDTMYFKCVVDTSSIFHP